MNERDDELLAGLALNSLDSEAEVAEAEALASSDPEAAGVLSGYRETAAALALGAAVAPPADLKDAVLRAISAASTHEVTHDATQDVAPAAAPDAAPPVTHDVVHDVVPFRRRRTATVWLAAAAAAAVLVAVPAVGVAISQHQRAVTAEGINAQITRLISQPGASLASAALPDGGTLSLVSTAGESAIVSQGMPAPGDGKTYQLWIIDAGAQPRSAGLVGSDAAITQARGLAKGTVVAITLEPAGGSAQPSSQPLAAVTVS